MMNRIHLRLFYILAVTVASAFSTLPGFSQTQTSAKLSVHWEELTASDFREGIHRSQGTCLLPFGILEKHGPHLPLGTDLLDVRYAAVHAAEQEYAVVFPEYYFGHIAEARHERGSSPGAVSGGGRTAATNPGPTGRRDAPRDGDQTAV